MALFFYLFTLFLAIGVSHASYNFARDMSEFQCDVKKIYLPPLLHKILFFDKYKPVRLLSVIYQCIITMPYILVQPFYLIYYLSFIGEIKVWKFLTIGFVLKLYGISLMHVMIGYFIFDFIRKILKPHYKVEVKFAIFMPWKTIILFTSIYLIVMSSILFIYDLKIQIVINFVFTLLFIIIVAIGNKICDRYSMNVEQLCGRNESFLRYKDISKVTISKRNILFGLEKQTLITVIDKKGTYFMNFCPNEPDKFIEYLKTKCPEAEYTVLNNEN